MSKVCFPTRHQALTFPTLQVFVFVLALFLVRFRAVFLQVVECCGSSLGQCRWHIAVGGVEQKQFKLFLTSVRIERWNGFGGVEAKNHTGAFCRNGPPVNGCHQICRAWT